MSESLRVALVGNPNCGKTSVFNQLTGTRQKVGNYAGVTVERKVGFFNLPSRKQVRVLDLPGAYSLDATSPDEAVTRDVCLGQIDLEKEQDAFLCVVDATNLKLHLRLVLEILELGRPVLVVLNMVDEARRRGIQVNVQKLTERLGVPVVETVGTHASGVANLIEALEQKNFSTQQTEMNGLIGDHHQKVAMILEDAVVFINHDDQRTEFLDRIFLHPVFGLISLVVFMFVIFQAVFAWAAPFMDAIAGAFAWFGAQIAPYITQPTLKSLIVDGIITGTGSVIVYLPQILFLFFFILVLEESGYLPRAAFLLDKLMYKAGLSGRAFIPLLSSFACAVPGIMATRSINDPRDRLITILVAPLMTCSARLPVYTLLIAAFIPSKTVLGFLNLQGVVLFVLYFAGILSALVVAFVVKLLQKDKSQHALIMELPSYRIPNPKSIAIGLLDRGKIFLKRVGGIIVALSVLLWFLSTFPQPPANATLPAIDYSFAGQLGHLMQPLFAPIGFNWEICIVLIPAMAARDVLSSALATVYALSGVDDDAMAQGLTHLISSPNSGWTIATGLSLLVWFIYAPHCLSTLATARRETGSWKTVAGMLAYLFGLAYLMSCLTYQIASRYFGL